MEVVWQHRCTSTLDFLYVTGGTSGERARFVVGPGGEIESSQGKD